MSNTYAPLYGVFDASTGALQGVCPVSGVVSSVSGNPVSVSGTPTVGQTLSANLATGWTATGYQWTRDGTNISGATSATYLLVSADSGHTVGVVASGLVYTTTGATISAGAAVAPTITAAPTLAANVAGSAVTWSTGTATGNPTPTITYALKKNGTVVSSNATSGSYSSTTAGDIFVVTMSAANSAGTDNQDSNSITTSAATPSSLSAPVIALVGDSITAYGNAQIGLTSGMTLTAASGSVTGSVSNTVFGNNEVYFNNLNDASFELAGRNQNYTSGAINVTTSHADGSTTAGTFGALTLWSRFTSRGIFMNLKSLFQGGLEFGGNYGHGAQTAAAMGAQMDYALSRNPSMVILMAGTNDIRTGSTTAATVRSSVYSLMQKCFTANIPVVVCAVMPVGTVYGGTYATINGTGTYGIQTLNSLLAADCAANPTKAVFADTFTPMYDSTSQCAYPTYVLSADGLHPTARGAIAMAQAVQTAMSSWVTAPVLLPTGSSDTGTVNGHTKFILKGPWALSSGGAFATGMTASNGSGTVGTLNYTPSGGTAGLPSGWQAQRTTGSPTGTCAIYDSGDGTTKGYKVQFTVQPAAANDSASVAPIWNATLTSLGLAQGDEICIAAEIDWSNATASGLGAVSLTVQSPSALYGAATTGETNEATGVLPDTMTGRVLVTGWLKINNASFTQLQAYVTAGFASAGSSPAVINIRRFTVYKR